MEKQLVLQDDLSKRIEFKANLTDVKDRFQKQELVSMNKYALADSIKVMEGQLQRILDILTHKVDRDGKNSPLQFQFLLTSEP